MTTLYSYGFSGRRKKSSTFNFEYEFEYEADFGDDYEYFYFDIEVSYCAGVDHNYGADADGNRGMTIGWLDDVEFVILKNGNDITHLVENSNPEFYKEISNDVENKANEDLEDRDDY